MSIIVGIDPGPTESAWVFYQPETRRVVQFGHMRNDDVRAILRGRVSVSPPHEQMAIEMIASYGMAVGKEVFETVYWIGRFAECWQGEHTKVYRQEVKQHLCHTNRATDANIRAALIDRYGPGKDAAIGTKKHQGPLYGLKGHHWPALAVAITFAETRAPIGAPAHA